MDVSEVHQALGRGCKDAQKVVDKGTVVSDTDTAAVVGGDGCA